MFPKIFLVPTPSWVPLTIKKQITQGWGEESGMAFGCLENLVQILRKKMPYLEKI